MIICRHVLTVLLFFICQCIAAQPVAENQAVKSNQAAVAQLLKDAELALKTGPFSVVDNEPVPPGKTKNDYLSWSPYHWPNPDTKDGYPYVLKDGLTNPHTERQSDKPLLRKMAAAVHTLALANAYSKEDKYAQKAVILLKTWFIDSLTRMNPNLNYGQCTPGIEKGNSVGIIDSRWLTLVCDAVPLLRKSGALAAADETALKTWFSDYLHWLLESKLGQDAGKRDNNHGSWYAAQTASYALFTGDKALAKKIVAGSKRFFDVQIDSLGRQKLELHRTRSFDYSLYNLHAFITLAGIGDQVGVDLWNFNADSKKNIRESIRFMAGYGTSEKKWPFEQIAEKAISLNYDDGDGLSRYYPYDLYAALRVGYKVYRVPYFRDVMAALPKEETARNRANLLIALD